MPSCRSSFCSEGIICFVTWAVRAALGSHRSTVVGWRDFESVIGLGLASTLHGFGKQGSEYLRFCE
ncbi:unnamed protein product [Prunus armeniaca]|uniref:Uncharacterized protein n=1 Tax=Prunus armeniaca TaxID=36596 RepID=A0A6J5WLY7_PRUAR|nr:unnamed protein product [Prunus armeniaca]